MRFAAATTSAKLGTSSMRTFQCIEFGDQGITEIIRNLAACPVIKAWARATTDQAALRRLARGGQDTGFESHGKQRTHHRLEAMVVPPLLQAIGVEGTAARATIAENADPVTHLGPHMRPTGKFRIGDDFACEPIF